MWTKCISLVQIPKSMYVWLKTKCSAMTVFHTVHAVNLMIICTHFPDIVPMKHSRFLFIDISRGLYLLL